MALRQWLCEELKDAFERQGEHGIVVWYDAGGTLESVVQQAMPQNTQLVCFDGSYLALRFALENEDPNFQGRWVIYIPEAPPRESWLRDWELFGVRLEMDLLELLHRKANIAITQRLTDLLRRRPQNARDLVRNWQTLVGDRTVNESTLLDALLALGFGLPGWRIEEAILLFLKGDISREQLEERGLWTVFEERVSEWMGWTKAPDDETELRRKLEAAILLSELVSALPDLSARFVGVLPGEPKRSFAANLARTWRDREDFRSCYLQASQRVEREYELGNLLTPNEALLRLETFAIVDEIWRQEVMNAVAPDGSNFTEKVERIGQIAEQRMNLFWAKQGQASYWRPIALAARLYQGCQRAMAVAERLSHLNEFVQHYTAEEGWWRFDLWALELAAKAQTLRAEERNRFVNPSWRAYGEYLDRVNRRFVEAVQREGWTPNQVNFWRQFVTSEQRTAVFLVDALRFDLAQRLRSLLPDAEFETTLQSQLGTLPSITEVGMAALLPGAEKGLQISVEGTQFQVRLDGEDVSTRQERKEWLEQRLWQRGKILELDEVERSKLEGVNVLVVQSRDVDEFGTFVADLHPQGILDMVDRIARAMRYLKEQGFELFLVTADHGFLFLPPEVQPNVVEAPMAKVRKRRFAVGGGERGCLVKRAEEIGLTGSEIFAFPVGLTVFALQGEVTAFLHGGISLQECIVPVLKAKAVEMAQKVSVVMELPSQLTSRMALITVCVKEANLFAQPRQVMVEIDGRRSEPVELSVAQRKVTVRLSWLDFGENPPPEVTVRLLDADSGQILEEHHIPVNMVV